MSMKIMVTSLKRSHACTATVHAPNPAADHHHASTRDSRTPTGKSAVGSLLLSPGSWCTRFCLPSKTISQSYRSSGSSMVGLMVTSSKRAYTIPMSATPRALVPAVDHCRPIPPQEMLKHSFVLVSVGPLNPGVHKLCLSLLSISGRNGI